MAEGGPSPPTAHWEHLIQSNQLTADVIRKFWKEWVPTVAANVVGLSPPNSSDEQRCRHVFLEPLCRLLLDGAPPLEQAAPAAVMCGKVFKNGDPTYNCRDCEQDPTCVLCVDCFKRSAHRRHRYQMCVSLGMGGYCDCGDAEAWKQEPCCSAHQPPPSEPARPAGDCATPAPHRAQTANAEQVFSAAVRYVLSAVTPEPNTVPIELDLGREHYPAGHLRYCTVIYNYGVTAYDKVADTLVTVIRCLPDLAKDVAAGVRKEGWAVLHVGDFNSCDAKVKGLVAEQERALRRAQVRVVHAHVLAHQWLTTRLIKHLRQLLETTPSLRPGFFNVMLQSSEAADQSGSLLECLLAVDPRLWKQARHECHLMLIQGMLMDIESKKHFAEVFTGRYHEQVLASLPATIQEQSTVHDLSVQIYTVPSISHHLISQHAALSVVLGTLVHELEPYTHGGQLVLRDVNSDTYSRRRFERLLTYLMDARYLLTVVPESPMPEPLQHGVRRGLDALLDLLFYCEGMEPVMRVQTAHVLYDTPYELQVTVALSLAPVASHMLDWCAADRELLVYAYKAVVAKLHASLPPDQYFLEEETALLGLTVRVSQYPVSTIPVSLELPLTRLFVGLYLHLARHGLQYDSEELACDVSVTPAGLLERPMRALIMDAQVRAGLWKRNGRSLEIMCSWYSLSMQVADMRDRDLQMMQICASLMNPDQLVMTLLFRHGAQLYFTPAADYSLEEGAQHDVMEHIENNLSDLLLLLIHVFGERYHPEVGQVTREQCLQNEVIQFLCVKPMAHSQIAKRLSEAKASLLEAALTRVADFSELKDYRGLRTYQLKPEFYSHYNCMWGHYSRRDRSLSEQLQLRRRQEAGRGSASACLPPPPTPAFQPRLVAVRRILNCDTTLRMLAAVLQRLGEPKRAAWSEQILQRCLFLIGMALNEEERDPTGFSFSRPAQFHGISEFLHALVSSGSASASSHSHSDLLTWVVTKLDGLLGEVRAPAEAARESAAADAESEQQRRRAAAALRQKRILAQMQAQQRRFVTQNQTALEAEGEVQSAAGAGPAAELPRADSKMDVSECAGPVCLGPSQSPRSTLADEHTCILCQLSEPVTCSRPAWVTAAFVQASTVLARRRHSQPSSEVAAVAPYVPSDLNRLLHTSSCGHAMHAACWRQHFDSVAWNRRVHPRVQYRAGFDVQKQEFLCPLCQRLSNTVVPILPAVVPTAAAVTDDRDTLQLWLATLQQAAHLPEYMIPATETKTDEAEPTGDTVLQRITKDWSYEDRCHIQRIVNQGDQPPEIHKTTRDMAHRYFKLVFTTAHGTKKTAGALVRQAALHCCVYSLHSAEQLLRHQGRALLALDASRAHICLGQLVHLCAGLLPSMAGGANAARESTRALLKLLLPQSQAASAAGGPLLVAADPLGLVVTLTCGLPALFSAEGHAVPVPSGSLQDLHCVRLALLVRLLQILLSMDVSSLDHHQPMDAEDGASEDSERAARERHWLAELYTRARSAAGQRVVSVSPVRLRQRVIAEVTPLLRCIALYFHLLTGVRAPAELQQPLPLDQEYAHLLGYLGLDSLCVPQATESDTLLHSCWLGWCTEPLLPAALAAPSTGALLSSRQARLIDLPAEYADLLIKASDFHCDCGESEVTGSPALCLVCGVLLCSEFARDLQPPHRTQRGIDAHALRCGAGVGVLLLIRKCKLYLVHCVDSTVRKSTYPPPYVDRFGEMDQGLRRGNPLTLQPDQYAKLNRLWLSHGVSDEVTRFMEEYSPGILFEQ